MIVFYNVELSIQRMKNFFVYNLWSWSGVVIDEGPLSLFSFINWVGSK